MAGAHSRHRDRRHVLRSRRARRLAVVGLAAALVAATASAFLGLPGLAPSGQAAASATCTSDGAQGCVGSLPCSGSSCPTVTVTPAKDLRNGQYVTVDAKNFPSDDSIRVAFCSGLGSTSDPLCMNGQWDSSTTAYAPTSGPVVDDSSSDNLTTITYPVFDQPNEPGNDPLPAIDLLDNEPNADAGFYCGDAADPCVLQITLEDGQGRGVGFGPPISTSNTVTIPLQFAAQSGGCPSTDPSVDVQNSYSLEHFLPAAVEATCSGSTGVVASNISQDNESAVSNFATGGTQVAFIDNPGDLSQAATLAGKGYAYIPVAVSGTVMSYLAGETSPQGVAIPMSTFDMTPNMVAGLITTAYNNPAASYTGTGKKATITSGDVLIPPLSCADLVGCAPAKSKDPAVENETQYTSFYLLNPVAPGGYPAGQYGFFNANVSSGNSYQATDWLCQAPNTPFDVTVDTISGGTTTEPVTDPTTASSTLTSSANTGWNPSLPWIFPTCQGYSTYPSLSATETNYGPASSPELQAKAIRAFAYGGGNLPQGLQPVLPPAGFGIMDSSEADFLGLNSASLQNAAGNFVAPTTASIEAALSAIEPCPTNELSCPAGTYTVNYDDTANADAYPMPDITYAVVPTGALPADQATAIKNLLTNLVTYSHTSTSLPPGYATLPTSLEQAALTDISADIVSEPAPPTPTKTVTPTPTTSPTTSPSMTGGPGTDESSGLLDDASDGSSLSTPLESSSLPSTAGDTGSGGSSGGSGRPKGGGSSGSGADSGTGFTSGTLVVSMDSDARWLLPAVLLAALLCLVAGPLLLAGPETRKRFARRRRDR